MLRPGYKQTEIGVIPDEWQLVPLGTAASCFSGGTPSTSIGRYYGGNIPWITSSDLNKARIFEVQGRITQEGFANSAAKMVERGTLLLALYGATAGVSAITDIRGAINQAVLAVIPKLMDTEFLFQLLRHRKDYYVTIYTQGGQPNLSAEIVKTFQLPAPPIPEQHAIASALSDADALVAEIDRLIAKKRDLKQAVMQQLLTGRTRLRSRSDEWASDSGHRQSDAGAVPQEWDVKPLGSVLTGARLGGNYPNQDNETEFPLMKMGNLARGHFDVNKVEFIRPGVIPEAEHRLRQGDVLFNTRNTLELVGKVAIWREELPLAYYNSNLMRLEFDAAEVGSNEYANYALNASRAVSQLRSLATGTTSVAAIYTRDLMELPFLLPPKTEQTAIAEVLSDMDAELVALEARRDKTRALKQAMAQELLTGKTRLVPTNA